MLGRKYLFSWQHLEINSVLLLKLRALSGLMMWSFSIRHFSIVPSLCVAASTAVLDCVKQ